MTQDEQNDIVNRRLFRSGQSFGNTTRDLQHCGILTLKFLRLLFLLSIAMLSACSSSNHPPVTALFSIVLDSEINLTWPIQQVSLDASLQNEDTTQSVTYQWSVVNGTSSQVTIATPTSQDTLVSFSIPDTYLLQLTAYNGKNVASASVIINVVTYEAPYVIAGDDVSIVLPNAQYQLNPVVGDNTTPADSLSYQWQTVPNGISGVTFSDSVIADPLVSFSSTGLYELELTVSDGEFSSSDTISITVLQSDTPGLSARPSNTDCIAPADALVDESIITLQPAFKDLPDLGQLIALRQAPGDSSQWYAASLDGVIVRFNNTATVNTTALFMDISSKVLSGGEQGLLGMDFHPDYANNGQLFLSYSAASANGRSTIVRARLVNNVWEFDTILEIDQPASNHNGGNILFGPDGYLYIGMGDGGGGNDPYNDPLGHGQDTRTLLGAMLRIDVDSAFPYAIPATNPFAGGALCNNPSVSVNANNCPEIFAWGLRNPWRWSFDRISNANNPQLWAGDVGQGAREEIDLIKINKNYGWKIMEGFICRPGEPSPCDQTGLELPLHDYPHTNSNRSIVGGYIYRGIDNPNINFLRGTYLFADTYSGRIWGLNPSASGYTATELINSNATIYSFAEDHQGELYALTAFGGAGNNILHITASSNSPSGNVATVLSKSGCVDPSDPRKPSLQTIAYDINSPLWSDNADKSRFFAIPNGSRIDVGVEGDLSFPVGSILGKHFSLQNQIIETRLLMHHQSGWAGYSYEWQYDSNGQAIDAFLLADSKTVSVAQQEWYFPSRTECFSCHRVASGVSLGPDTRQLNRKYHYAQSNIIADQLTTLNSIDVFSTPLAGTLLTNKMENITDTNIDLQTRVKSYLHSNCSHCHQPGTGLLSTMDLRFATPLASMNVCDQLPLLDNLGLTDPRIIDPAGTFDAPNSILTLRMEATPLSGNRMPPLASGLVDELSVSVIKSWINSLNLCP